MLEATRAGATLVSALACFVLVSLWSPSALAQEPTQIFLSAHRSRLSLTALAPDGRGSRVRRRLVVDCPGACARADSSAQWSGSLPGAPVFIRAQAGAPVVVGVRVGDRVHVYGRGGRWLGAVPARGRLEIVEAACSSGGPTRTSGRGRSWRIGWVCDGPVWLAVDERVVLVQGRGAMRCVPRGERLACLYTHVSQRGLQSLWVVDLGDGRARRVAPVGDGSQIIGPVNGLSEITAFRFRDRETLEMQVHEYASDSRRWVSVPASLPAVALIRWRY